MNIKFHFAFVIFEKSTTSLKKNEAIIHFSRNQNQGAEKIITYVLYLSFTSLALFYVTTYVFIYILLVNNQVGGVIINELS